MDIYLLASREDIAGMNISRFIHSHLQGKISIADEISILSDQTITNVIPSDATVIYLSRHSAQSLRPSLTVHSIGNFGKAEFGGRANTLVECDSFLMKRLLLNIQDLKPSGDYNLLFDYEISLEVTHHGPFSKPAIVFIEVGSSEPQWNDLEACRLIADAVNNTQFDNLTQGNEWISVIGFGGNHYATKFTRFMIESEYAFGHICAKYAIPHLTQELIQQMIIKTTPPPELVLFDKKGMKQKQQIKTWLIDFDIEVIQI
ncbi:MAG: D-aminoacyl-tRNA deacylase [Candidatus Hodarchaeota archaeon]